MKTFYASSPRPLVAALLLAAVGPALAQAPVITSVVPMANARAVAPNSAVTVNFSPPLTAASAGALKVFSSQRGGLRTRGATPATVNGSALSFAPTTYPYMPGETVRYTVTTAAAGSGGAMAQSRVGQFTAAVGGTGTGSNFSLPSANAQVATNYYPSSVALGDIDGDGDLDFVTANNGTTSIPGSVSLGFNNGSGVFSRGSDVAIGLICYGVALGDLDGDGDLDLLIANQEQNGTVSVRLNNGNGTFVAPSSTPEVTVSSYPGSVIVGDVDGNGDLDLLTAATINTYGTNSGNTVSVRLNNGAGVFTTPTRNPEVTFSKDITGLALGDVDSDGDFDLLTTNYRSSAAAMSVRLNDGQGSFTASTLYPDLVIPAYSGGVVLGDVDGDGDLDALTGATESAFLWLNDGQGNFSGSIPSNEIYIGSIYISNVVLGDMDGDGDLDLIGTTLITGVRYPGARNGHVRICFNNGQGNFASPTSASHFSTNSDFSTSTALGDIDGDGDLDFVVANYQGFTVSVHLNSSGPLATATGRTAAALSAFPNPARGAATVTGATPNAPLTILDAVGRALLTATTDATGTARLPLEGLPAGVYLVRCGEQVRRLTVE
ncbi:FG-GAP-like repeat-containing protein [Hymenobacter properus]|uniref:VCBS repeat-containing protein n=1 Tax=Hymenobacter properus TaxID=2791026 RepID=A0A931BCL6_9BACT|nr:FG-GAP-like repeat-containing protein [Hymenobacter properus]MBF9141380.1 VCBS repeat-containing protein [Hymenobacter properus]MBR7720189.1 VCBS repeat-containing protein [Microvirga sp. SRT04]